MAETKETAIQGREYEGVSIPPAGTYELDPVHTMVGFVARHMLSKVRGQFTEFTGMIEVGDSPEDSRVAVEVKIKGITRPVTLSGEFLGWGPKMDGKPMLAASAKTTIDREDWDMTWNVAVETGGFLVGKKVDLEIEVEAH